MADDRIEIEIVLDDGSIQKGFAKVRSEAKKTAKRLNVNFGGLQRTLIGLTAAFAGVFAGRKILAAAQQQENAVKQLNTSLRLAGSFSNEASQSFQQFASELQNVTRFGDEQILQQAALARNFARTNDEAQRLVSAAVDLSEATGITLDSAVRNLGKTFSGLTGELGESVPALRNLTAEQLKAGGALDLVAQRFGGAAARNVETFSGRVQQLGNAFGDFFEQIGLAITQSPVTIKVLGELTKSLTGLVGSLKTIRETDDILKQLLQTITIFAKGVNMFIVAPLELAVNIINAIFKSILTITQGFILSFIETLNLILFPLTDLLGDDSKLSKLINQFRETTSETLDDLADDTGKSFEKILDFDFSAGLDEKLDQFNEFVQNIKDGPVQELNQTIDNTVAKTPIIFDTFVNTFIGFTDLIGELFSEFSNKLFETVEFTTEQSKQLAQGFSSVFAGGISQAIQTTVKALVDGENAFEALGKSILSLIGDLAIFVGQFTVAVGISKIALEALPGGAAIAAGLGLIALGSLLKALGGSSFVGGSQGAGAVGGGAIAPSPAELIAEQEETALEPIDQTRVALTIQGDVLDSRETGLRIIDILNESFETEGTVLAT